MSEQRRLWCSLHHSFWRDCSACVEADYANLERQLAEAQGRIAAVEERQRTWTAWGQVTPRDDKHATYLDGVAELATDLGAILHPKEGE